MPIIDFENEKEAVTRKVDGGAVTKTVTVGGKKVTKLTLPPGFNWKEHVAVGT